LNDTGSNGSGIMIQGNEGYMIHGPFGCYADNGQSDTGNWQAPVVSEPKGPNTFPLTITRSTTDGLYALTQKFSWGKNYSSIVIQMSLSGDTGGGSTFLWRYGDVVYGGSNQLMDYTNRSAFIWSDLGHLGLMARTIPPFNVLDSLGSDPRAIGGVQNLCGGIDGSKAKFPYQGDSALALFWQAANKGISITMEYIPMQ
jgi:hypothetical protein